MSWFLSKRTGYTLVLLNVVIAVVYYGESQALATFAACAATAGFTKLWYWDEIEG